MYKSVLFFSIMSLVFVQIALAEDYARNVPSDEYAAQSLAQHKAQDSQNKSFIYTKPTTRQTAASSPVTKGTSKLYVDKGDARARLSSPSHGLAASKTTGASRKNSYSPDKINELYDANTVSHDDDRNAEHEKDLRISGDDSKFNPPSLKRDGEYRYFEQ